MVEQGNPGDLFAVSNEMLLVDGFELVAAVGTENLAEGGSQVGVMVAVTGRLNRREGETATRTMLLSAEAARDLSRAVRRAARIAEAEGRKRRSKG